MKTNKINYLYQEYVKDLNEKNDEINKEEPSCGQIFQYITSNYSFFHRYFDSISKEETGMYKFIVVFKSIFNSQILTKPLFLIPI